MKVRGSISETVIIVKEIEVEVPDDADEDAIHTAVRDKAYERIVTDIKYEHGWELAETVNVDVTWVTYSPCHGCGKERPDDDEHCPECGTQSTCCPP